MNKPIAIILIIIYIIVIYKLYSDSKIKEFGIFSSIVKATSSLLNFGNSANINENYSNYFVNHLNKCNKNYVQLNKSYNKVLDNLYKEREIHSKKVFDILEKKYLRDTSFIKSQDNLISILENNIKRLIKVFNKKKGLINKYINQANTKGRDIKYIKEYNYSKSYFNVILKTILLITCIVLLVLILYNSFA